MDCRDQRPLSGPEKSIVQIRTYRCEDAVTSTFVGAILTYHFALKWLDNGLVKLFLLATVTSCSRLTDCLVSASRDRRLRINHPGTLAQLPSQLYRDLDLVDPRARPPCY